MDNIIIYGIADKKKIKRNLKYQKDDYPDGIKFPGLPPHFVIKHGAYYDYR